MEINDHIAAIKEHLKAIEEGEQAKKEPRHYLVVEVDGESYDEIFCSILQRMKTDLPFFQSLMSRDKFDAERWKSELLGFICSGKIITVNEE